jgi:maleylacetoacetate isomerase
MLLHGYFRSSASFRVRIAFNLKKIEHENAYHHLRRNEHRTPEYLALNPQGLLPALEVDGVVLTQSLAILEYLDELWPEPALLPADSLGRARVRGLAQIVACDIHPIDNLRVLRYLRDPLGIDEPTVQAWYNHWIAEGFAALEAQLAKSPLTGRFCHGDKPGLADICLFPQVVNSRNFGLDLSPYPTILRIFDACKAMPAFETAMPANQPDADPA